MEGLQPSDGLVQLIFSTIVKGLQPFFLDYALALANLGLSLEAIAVKLRRVNGLIIRQIAKLIICM